MDKAHVSIPKGHPNPPEEHEVEAAWIIARHFNTRVDFLLPIDSYKMKSQDIVCNGAIWEIKSPIGKSKTTVKNQFKRARKQRANSIIFDARRIGLKNDDAMRLVRYEMAHRKSIKRILFIDENNKVIEITD